MERSATGPHEAGAAAVSLLRLFALTAVGYHWHRAARVALPRANDGFYRAKRATARFYMMRILPETVSLHAAATAGAASIMDMEPDLF
jgi:hypothetical protein